jgi:hypothetical protein
VDNCTNARLLHDAVALYKAALHKAVAEGCCRNSLPSSWPASRCTRLLHEAVAGCCTRLLQAVAQGCCTRLLHEAVAQGCCKAVAGCCTRPVQKAVAQGCCTRLLHKAAAQGCCTAVAHGCAALHTDGWLAGSQLAQVQPPRRPGGAPQQQQADGHARHDQENRHHQARTK